MTKTNMYLVKANKPNPEKSSNSSPDFYYNAPCYFQQCPETHRIVHSRWFRDPAKATIFTLDQAISWAEHWAEHDSEIIKLEMVRNFMNVKWTTFEHAHDREDGEDTDTLRGVSDVQNYQMTVMNGDETHWGGIDVHLMSKNWKRGKRILCIENLESVYGKVVSDVKLWVSEHSKGLENATTNKS